MIKFYEQKQGREERFYILDLYTVHHPGISAGSQAGQKLRVRK